MLHTFSTANFHTICDQLSSQDPELAFILTTYGYPPMWTRPNTFESLVHIILEQQVSLASALAALNKLKEKLGKITPAKLLALTDEELKACYFSRQKMSYARFLASAIQSRQFSFKALETLPDDEVRAKLVALKGIGNWTADVYLMFVLQRADIFPIGDLAAVNALKQVKKLPKDTAAEKLLHLSAAWQPNRTVATMILWHYYLSLRAKDTSPETSKIKKAVSL
ncbi:DNA-3-methyladenine glycosylase family protein [Chitinophaga arvensicola]|uniref:DNA-3-methyladenine glycosylase II n=1 Tax=Chitinophaga arvensicola TaxID=29529 RepID=A0A1I0PFD3_9BACT|nr:DNA-3-methyladenine glycosylase [Chitinophaga arvensicola]SEW13133.1 DNA-3-methyladenine glycosylase II [Chitinophaga arvensicola]